MNYMTIYRASLADGEGWRTVLFVSGCHHHCKECHNKESWNPNAGQPFTKEFDPYDVDPEYADFPEFAALCMYIQNTDETADMLANEYFATDDILEKCDYLDKMQGFPIEGIFEKTQSMMDNIDKLMATLHQVTGMRNDINSFFEPFFTKYLVEDVELSDYPDIAGAISEELSSEKITEEVEPEETTTESNEDELKSEKEVFPDNLDNVENM